MSLSAEQLKHLAMLAYLQLDETALAPLTHDLNAIIDFVTQLQTVDTTAVQPLHTPIDNTYQRLRSDEAHIETNATKLANIAPSFKDNLYLVPKVIQSR